MNIKYSRMSGFTLVELLVVIAIIGVLVSMLLPAVQSAREAARRAQCMNQMKQIGLAILNYESANTEFPPGGVAYGIWGYINNDKQPILCDRSVSGNPDCNGTNWAIETLPYMEEQQLYDLYDQDEENLQAGDPDGDGLANQVVRDTVRPSMICPSDFYAAEYNGALAATSYKGMAGVPTEYQSGSWLNWTNPARYEGQNGSNPDVSIMKEFFHRRGILYSVGLPGLDSPELRNVTDGTSKTLMMGEFHALGISEEDSPAWWAVSRRWHNKAMAFADPVTRTNDVERCVAEVVSPVPVWVCNMSFGSNHAGDGGNWLRVDGSVSFITSTLDGDIYEAMGTIAGEEVANIP